jgi:hypothetical protein
MGSRKLIRVLLVMAAAIANISCVFALDATLLPCNSGRLVVLKFATPVGSAEKRTTFKRGCLSLVVVVDENGRLIEDSGWSHYTKDSAMRPSGGGDFQIQNNIQLCVGPTAHPWRYRTNPTLIHYMVVAVKLSIPRKKIICTNPVRLLPTNFGFVANEVVYRDIPSRVTGVLRSFFTKISQEEDAVSVQMSQ